MTPSLVSAEERVARVAPTRTSLPASPTATAPVNLPSEFWAAREALARIRTAAQSRIISADALLGVVLARTCASIPPHLVLPPIIGTHASLNTFVALVAPSGAGKSSAMGCGAELLSLNPNMVIGEAPIGSGEGLIEAYLAGGSGKAKVQATASVLASVDEGEALAQQGSRRGATLFPVLRSMWTGGVQGQANASMDRRRRLEAHSYRLAALIGYQPEHAARLIADDAGGTPQRFVWLSGLDPSIPSSGPAWPGPLPQFNTAAYDLDDRPDLTPITVEEGVSQEIAGNALRRSRGDAVTASLDAHGDLVRLKAAALLAALDQRLDVNPEDWHLAGVLMATSRAVRTKVIDDARRHSAAKDERAAAKAAYRQNVLQTSEEEHALTSCATTVANRVHRHGRQTRRDLQQALGSKGKPYVTVDDAIERAITEGWIASDGDGYSIGETRPT